MNRLDEKILTKIFLFIDCLNELLQISMVCRQWRKLIIKKDFFQKRFINRRQKYLINHWKFDKISNKYLSYGCFQYDICFLGSCLLFDAHSSLIIPLDNYSSKQFSISLWIQNTSSVNSWRTIFDINLFQYGFIHLGITPQSKLETNYSLIPNEILIKCRSNKQSIVRYLWYHIVILISNNKQILYLNGQFQKEIEKNFSSNNQLNILMKEIFLGMNSKGFDCWFGRIADLSIWNRWLDIIEIKSIWQQRVSIDQIDLGEYFIKNFYKKQFNHYRSVLL